MSTGRDEQTHGVMGRVNISTGRDEQTHGVMGRVNILAGRDELVLWRDGQEVLTYPEYGQKLPVSSKMGLVCVG